MVIDFWSPGCPPCVRFKPEFEKMAQFYGSDKVKFFAVNTQESRDIAANFNISSIPAFFVYKNGTLVENFVGANKDKLIKLVEQLKKDLGDEIRSSSAGALPTAPVVDRYAPDLGFIVYNPRSTWITKFENMKNLSKMGAKLKEIAEAESADNFKALMNDFALGKVTPEVLNEVMTIICTAEPKYVFPLFDFLRCCFLTESYANHVVTDGWDIFSGCLDKLELFTEALEVGSTDKFKNNSLLTGSNSLCNLFIHESSSKAITSDEAKTNRMLEIATFLVKCPQQKVQLNAGAIVLSTFV